MTTGFIPIPNFYFYAPIGVIWCLPVPVSGFYTLVPIPPIGLNNTILMGTTQSLDLLVYSTNLNANMTLNNMVEIENEPMHQLERERPMDFVIEEEEFREKASKTGIIVKKELEEIDYSDMPQLTRMDC